MQEIISNQENNAKFNEKRLLRFDDLDFHAWHKYAEITAGGIECADKMIVSQSFARKYFK
jgi:hypothetical protein